MNLVAVIEIVIICIYFILPTLPRRAPVARDFEWKFVNYAPILTLGSLVLLTIWWQRLGEELVHRARSTTIDPDVVDAFED